MSVKNVGRLIAKLNQMPVAARGGIGTALAVSAFELDAYAKQKIQGGSRTGRSYKRGKNGRFHRASGPGEFPKTDSGQLVASMFVKVASDKLSAFFGTALAYGKYLEFGTSRMAARPWLRPTFKSNEDRITRRVNEAITQSLRKFTGNG